MVLIFHQRFHQLFGRRVQLPASTAQLPEALPPGARPGEPHSAS